MSVVTESQATPRLGLNSVTLSEVYAYGPQEPQRLTDPFAGDRIIEPRISSDDQQSTMLHEVRGTSQPIALDSEVAVPTVLFA